MSAETVESMIEMELTDTGRRAREIDAAIAAVVSRVKTAFVAACIAGEPSEPLVQTSRLCDALERAVGDDGVAGALLGIRLGEQAKVEELARDMVCVAIGAEDALWRVYLSARNVTEPVSRPYETEDEAIAHMDRIARVIAMAIGASRA